MRGKASDLLLTIALVLLLVVKSFLVILYRSTDKYLINGRSRYQDQHMQSFLESMDLVKFEILE